MKPSRIVIALAATLTLAACATDQHGPKQGLGTLIGAGLGGLVGSQIGGGTGQLVAVGAGVLLGGLLGNDVGRSLDKADELYATRHAQDTLEYAPTGMTSSWSNPDSGNSGTFTPSRTYTTSQGQYCREYQTTVTVGGEVQSAYGTACRKPDGSWEITG